MAAARGASAEVEPESQVRRALNLRTFPAFSGLGPDALAVLARPCAPRSFAPGETLLEPGGATGELHFILEGAVDVLEDGEVVRTMNGREAVGGLAVMDPRAAEVHARARAPTRTLALAREDLRAVFEDHPDIRVAVTRAVARTLRNVLDRRRLLPRLSGGAEAPAADPEDLVQAVGAMTSALEFCEVTVAAAADLVRDAKAVELEAGAALWRPGDDASDLLVVFAGRLRAFREGSEPATYGPGQVAGLLEALAEGPRWYALVAETPATAMRLSSDVLLDVADEHPELASGLLAALARAAAAHFRRS